ncbi:MAG: hypothetical protein KBD78_15305 [Oligoflexales bacterium]|nr:hypothetical protein [Oligoflexales bacterium]
MAFELSKYFLPAVCQRLIFISIRTIKTTVFGVITVSCGLSSPLYKAYSSDSADKETCETSLTYFKDNIEPAVISTCATGGCHGASTKIDGSNLSTVDSEQTMRVFRKYGIESLFAKYSSNAHGGGALGGVLALDKLKAWKEIDDTPCP